MQVAWNGWMSVRRFGAQLGPYLVIEMLLPGGTLVAVLLYAFRRYRGDARPVLAGVITCGTALGRALADFARLPLAVRRQEPR